MIATKFMQVLRRQVAGTLIDASEFIMSSVADALKGTR